MDALAQILTSPNALVVLAFAVVLVVVLGVMGKRGVYSVNRGGIKIGRTESEVRSLLMKEIQFVRDFCAYKRQKMLAEWVGRGHPLDPTHTELVFERMLDEVLSWIIVNNIRDDPVYIENKARGARMTIGGAIGEMNPGLLRNPDVMAYMDKIALDFTNELVRGLLALKREEGEV